MNVLSLFDGMSGGQQALEKAGVDVTRYYASEVDPYAMQITQKNYPKTIQLGSITTLNKKQLKKLEIDFVIGGSPCQGFSMAGKMKGMSTKQGVEITTLKQYKKLKKKGFIFDGQSYLFWEYVRVLHIVKPKYFLLENIRVHNKWRDIFNRIIGVPPIFIDSRAVCCQSRGRYYWTNIKGATGLESTNRYTLQNIIDVDAPSKYTLTDKAVAIHNQKGRFDVGIATHDEVILSTRASIGVSATTIGTLLCQHNVENFGGKTFLYNKKSKCYRRMTPVECERLQTVKDGYTDGVSDTQRYKMLGNGFTIDVIAHLLKGMV